MLEYSILLAYKKVTAAVNIANTIKKCINQSNIPDVSGLLFSAQASCYSHNVTNIPNWHQQFENKIQLNIKK
jgi:hypothetical protein